MVGKNVQVVKASTVTEAPAPTPMQEQVNQNLCAAVGVEWEAVDVSTLTTTDKCRQHFESLQNAYVKVSDVLTELDTQRCKIVLVLAAVQQKFKLLNSEKDDLPVVEGVQNEIHKHLTKQNDEEQAEDEHLDESENEHEHQEDVVVAPPVVKKTTVKKAPLEESAAPLKKTVSVKKVPVKAKSTDVVDPATPVVAEKVVAVPATTTVKKVPAKKPTK